MIDENLKEEWKEVRLKYAFDKYFNGERDDSIKSGMKGFMITSIVNSSFGKEFRNLGISQKWRIWSINELDVAKLYGVQLKKKWERKQREKLDNGNQDEDSFDEENDNRYFGDDGKNSSDFVEHPTVIPLPYGARERTLAWSPDKYIVFVGWILDASLSDTSQSLLLTLLYILDHPNTRQHSRQSLDIQGLFAPFTELDPPPPKPTAQMTAAQIQALKEAREARRDVAIRVKYCLTVKKKKKRFMNVESCFETATFSF